MTEELEKLREYLHTEKPALDTLEGVVADIVLKDRGVRDLLIKLCIRTGVFQSFMQESTHDLLFINHCKAKLVNEHFFSEAAAEKAMVCCKYLTQREIELVRDTKEGMLYFMDKYSYKIIPHKYKCVTEFYEGLASVLLDGKWGYIDKTGQEIITCKYDRVFNFIGGKARVVFVNKWGFIDYLGKEVIPVIYDYVDSFIDGLALTQLNGKYGFINENGKVIIDFKYDYAENFSEELSKIKLDSKWGFINKIGIEIIRLIFDEAYSFKEGLALVKQNGKFRFLVKNGNEINYAPLEVVSSQYIRAADPAFAGRKKEEGGEYLLIRQADGNIMKVELEKECPGVTTFNIVKFKTMDQIEMDHTFIKAFGIIEEEE